MKVGVVDYNLNTWAYDVEKSLCETGFVVLKNTELDVEELMYMWKEFFLSPIEYKRKFESKYDRELGYRHFGGEKAVGADYADLKEFLHVRPFDEDVPLLAPMKVIAEIADVSDKMENIIAEVIYELEVDRKLSEAIYNSNRTVIRALYYPPIKDLSGPAVRAAEHKDISFLTLLPPATAPGLQVKDLHGNWHDVPYEPGAIVINVGESLELLSNGLYKATPHRVVNPDNSTEDRVSMPVFFHLDSRSSYNMAFQVEQALSNRLEEIDTKV